MCAESKNQRTFVVGLVLTISLTHPISTGAQDVREAQRQRLADSVANLMSGGAAFRPLAEDLASSRRPSPFQEFASELGARGDRLNCAQSSRYIPWPLQAARDSARGILEPPIDSAQVLRFQKSESERRQRLDSITATRDPAAIRAAQKESSAAWFQSMLQTARTSLESSLKGLSGDACRERMRSALRERPVSLQLEYQLRVQCLDREPADSAHVRESLLIDRLVRTRGADVEVDWLSRKCYSYRASSRSLEACGQLFARVQANQLDPNAAQCAALAWVRAAVAVGRSAAVDSALSTVLGRRPTPLVIDDSLRANLIVKALYSAPFPPPVFKRWRDRLLETLPRMVVSPSVLSQLRTASSATDLMFRRNSEATRSIVIAPPASGTSVREVFTRHGIVPFLMAIDEMPMAMLKAFVSIDSSKGDLGQKALDSIARQPSFVAQRASTMRLMYEVLNLQALRALGAEGAADRLASETPLLLSSIIRRCGTNDSACLRAYYPVVRASKGLLALTLDTAAAPRAYSFLRVSANQQREIDLLARRVIERPATSNAGSGVDPALAALNERIGGLVKANPTLRDTVDQELQYLKQGETFVDFYLFLPNSTSSNAHYGVFVSTPGKPTRFADLGSSHVIETLIENWRREVTNQHKAEWDSATTLLRRRVWDPILSHIPPSVSRIVVAADGDLSRVSWSMLVGSEVSSVSLTSSWGQFLYNRTRKSSPASRRVATIDRIDFGAGATFDTIEIAFDAAGGFRRAGWDAQELSGRTVTHNTLRAAALKSQVLHFVTHGRTSHSTDQNPVRQLRSARLALSLANSDSRRVLTAEQLATWDLSSVALTVLAACETGDGAALEGQGSLGFPLALAAAGAKTSLVSLWPAPNGRSTTIFLASFYEALLEKGMTFGEAVGHAQQQVRADPAFLHPYFWSGWVILGEHGGRLQ